MKSGFNHWIRTSFGHWVNSKSHYPILMSNLSKKDANIMQAKIDLQNAINQLSGGKVDLSSLTSHHVSVSSNLIKKISNNSESLKELKIKDIEDLARLYFEGNDSLGLKKDIAKAVELWHEGSLRDSLESTYSFAVCKREGVGTSKDLSEAFHLLKALAENHDYALAHYSLAIMYENGEGTEINHEKSFFHNKKASDGGILLSLRNVANSYANGIGVEKNELFALKYYEASAALGDESSKFTLATWLYQGRGVERNLNRSFQLQLEAASAGIPSAMFNVGMFYLSGEVVDKDITKAIEWLEKAANTGNLPEAAVNLALIYQTDSVEIRNAIPKNLSKAAEYLSKYAFNHKVCNEQLKDIQRELDNHNPS